MNSPQCTSPSDARCRWEVIVTDDHEAMSRAAAGILVNALRDFPDLKLCTATGGSPRRTYELFVESVLQGAADAQSLQVVKLDEWGGPPADNPSTCHAYLRRHLVDPLGIPQNRFHGFECRPVDPAAECARMAAWMTGQPPIDLCVLGLGVNGHLGFNEPAAFLQPHAHVAVLSPASLTHGMLAEGQAQPTYGMTLGMADILASRRILLLVSGIAKQEPLHRLFQPRLDPTFPGSFLWLHPQVTLMCDRHAWGPHR